MLELYYWEPNGSWLKPLIALNEKGLPFTGHYVDVLAFEQFGADFPQADMETRLNQEGEGPLLVHDGRQVTESLFMLEYLEDAFPEATPLRPGDPLGNSRILAWARFINEVFMPGVNTLGCQRYLAPQLKGRDAAALAPILDRMPMKPLRDGWEMALRDGYTEELLAESRRKVELGVKRFEEALQSSGWLVGSAYSLADIDAFSMCNCLPSLTPELVNGNATPRVLEWIERIRARPAVRVALALSRTGKPEEAFAPGPEHARWG